MKPVAADVNRRTRRARNSTDSHLRLHRKKEPAHRQTPASAGRRTSAWVRWRGPVRWKAILPAARRAAPGCGHIPHGFAAANFGRCSWLIRLLTTGTAREASRTCTTGWRIARRNFHRRVGLAGRRAADEQRQFQAFAFHLAGDVRHFVQRRRDQPAQADDVHLLLAGGLRGFFRTAPSRRGQ